jgi:hypothetical protein
MPIELGNTNLCEATYRVLQGNLNRSCLHWKRLEHSIRARVFVKVAHVEDRWSDRI